MLCSYAHGTTQENHIYTTVEVAAGKKSTFFLPWPMGCLHGLPLPVAQRAANLLWSTSKVSCAAMGTPNSTWWELWEGEKLYLG